MISCLISTLTCANAPHALVVESMDRLEYNTSNLFAHDIDQVIKNLQTQAFFNHTNEQQLLSQLKQSVEEKIAYHQARINNRIDKDHLQDGALWAGLTLAGILTTYGIYRLWHTSYNNQFDALCADLKSKLKASVTEEMSSCGNSITNTITVSVPRGLTTDQMSYAEQCKNRLVSLRTKKQYALKAECMALTATLFPAIPAWDNLRRGLFPRHKARYEQLCLARDRIEQVLQEAKK